ncbi:class D sortase [Edaphobacter bradus]|uniref:class D sortase n=1 Tax=Edaphobacter bradus TaxID=2259016 RepID=UPI0021E0ECCC|nr:class D sortase [Edaphobacter bradus]
MAVGLTLLAVYLGIRIHGELSSRLAVLAFQAAQSSAPAPEERSDGQTISGVDVSLWSEKRIAAFKQSLTQHFDPPKVLLRISKIHLEVPVFEGTDDLTLNRGVGRITGTARVGMNGNIGIAGHRDGFFRGLKDIQTGDTVDLVMPDRTEKFAVDKIQIVDPNNVSVLQSGPISSLTLVTCYPFYFIGSAPRRYIVHASLIGSEPSGIGTGKQFISISSSDSHQERTE